MQSNPFLLTEYHCPLCGRTMARDLALFLDHTNLHVIDEIKKKHPEWVETDGACQPCVQYYKKAFSGSAGIINIGPEGRKRRVFQGTTLLILSAAITVYFYISHAAASLRFWLFFPLYFSALCLVQAREKTCAILAITGKKDMDEGEEKIKDAEIAEALRMRGRKIMIQSAFLALTITLILFVAA